MPQVGVLDSVGAALRDPNGPVNWPEFGDPNTEDGFKSLVGMSAYQKVRDGTPFPAVMLSHGFNDPRVAVWHSAKDGGTAATRQQQREAGVAQHRLRLRPRHRLDPEFGQPRARRPDQLHAVAVRRGRICADAAGVRQAAK
jgi:hypothetical protein